MDCEQDNEQVLSGATFKQMIRNLKDDIERNAERDYTAEKNDLVMQMFSVQNELQPAAKRVKLSDMQPLRERTRSSNVQPIHPSLQIYESSDSDSETVMNRSSDNIFRGQSSSRGCDFFGLEDNDDQPLLSLRERTRSSNVQPIHPSLQMHESSDSEPETVMLNHSSDNIFTEVKAQAEDVTLDLKTCSEGDYEEDLPPTTDQGITGQVNKTLSTNMSFSTEVSDRADADAASVASDKGSDKENADPKPRRKPQKIVKVFGQRITEMNAMPTLSENLKENLHRGIIDRVTLNREVYEHLEKITTDLYLNKIQWHMVCSKLITEYPILADEDDPLCYEDLKYKLRNSIASKKSYRLNGVPKRSGQPRPIPREQQGAGPSDELTRRSSITEKALQDLQQGKGNSEQLKELIRFTLNEHREGLKEKGPTELLLRYPHYRNAELLIYEYTLIVNFDLNTLQENSKTLIDKFQKLQDHFLQGLEGQLLSICNIQKELIPKRLKNKKLKGAIVCKDAAEVYMDMEALSTGHAKHAPFLVVIVDTNQNGQRVISKALLLYDEGVISQFDNPAPSEILLFLLAAYFVLDLSYPDYYNSFLRLLEKQIHGELSYGTNSSRAKQEYNHFLKTKFNQLSC